MKRYLERRGGLTRRHLLSTGIGATAVSAIGARASSSRAYAQDGESITVLMS